LFCFFFFLGRGSEISGWSANKASIYRRPSNEMADESYSEDMALAVVEDSDAEDGDAEDSDTRDSDAEDSNTRDSAAEDSAAPWDREKAIAAASAEEFAIELRVERTYSSA
jgi:hypothetical protein